MAKVVKVPKEKVKKAKAVEKVVEKPAPKAEPKKTKKINKSAKDGKIVSKDFAKENPETTFEQVVEIAADEPPPPSPMPIPDPTSKFYRNGDHIIEICGDVVTKHWVENGVHCTAGIEAIELPDDAVELSRSEMFRELSGN